MKIQPVYVHEDEEMYQVNGDYAVVVRPDGKNACTCTHGTFNLGKPDGDWSFCRHLEQVLEFRDKEVKGFKKMFR